MLPKNRRIPRKDFTYILQRGKRFHSPHFTLYIAHSEPQSLSQFSFSISKKIYKGAVDRNVYRRRGYNIISKKITEIPNGYFFLFTYKKGLYPVTFLELEKEVLDLVSNVIR